MAEVVQDFSGFDVELFEKSEKVLKELATHHERIGDSLRQAAARTELVAKCECGGDLRIIKSRKTGKRFVGCTNYSKGCRVSYPLPQRGTIILTGKSCPSCGSPIIKVRSRRTYEMCLDPNCETKKNWKKKTSRNNN